MISDIKMDYLLSNIALFLLKVKRKIELRHKKTPSRTDRRKRKRVMKTGGGKEVHLRRR